MSLAPPSGEPERDGPASRSSDAPASTSFGPTSFAEALGPLPKLTLAGERPAREHLAARSAVLEFQQRADWLESEAKRHPDSPARARLLLAASEVRALLGAQADARRLAVAAERCASDTPWAAEQGRALCQTPGEWAAAARELRESGATQLAAVRAHERLMASEITRVKQRIESAAEADLEASRELDPSSTRVALMRLVRQLSKSRKLPDTPPGPDDPLAPLADAIERLRRCHAEGASDRAASDNPAEVLAGALRSAARGNLEASIRALSALPSRPGFADLRRWLNTLASGGDGSSGAEGDAVALEGLLRGASGRLERRLLAARALRAGRHDLLLEAWSEPSQGAEPAFSAKERRALSALLGVVDPRPPAAPASARPLDDPLELALTRLSTSGTPPGPNAPVATELGLGLATGAMARFAELAEGQKPAGQADWALLLDLERAREAGDRLALSSLLPSFAAQHSHDAHFVAAVLAEQSGERESARQHYQAALPSNACREAATRALATPTSESAALFRALSAHARDARERSLLLTEALLRLSPEAPEFDALADEAVRADPSLPIAYHLGEMAARMRGDRARVARWLARQREDAGGTERLFCSIREALFWAGSDDARARSLLEPSDGERQDLTLELISEPWRRPSALARARFREQLAQSSTPEGRKGWLTEAIELYLEADQREAALGCARALGGPIGRAWGAELSRSPEELLTVIESWVAAARESGDAVLAADLYERASRLASERGDREQARALARQALSLAPDSLGALRALEVDAMQLGRELDWFDVAARLAERLPTRDALPYLFVAARLAIDRGDYEAARPFAERACSVAPAPLWALRLATGFARAAGDDARLIELCHELAERAQRPLDLATLALRAAQAAARLGRWEMARTEIERARTAAPDNVVIAAARAELLGSANASDSAHAYEDLAALCRSRAHRSEALRRAAQLWMEIPGEQARAEALLASADEVAAPPPPPPEAAPTLADDRAKLEITRALGWIDAGEWNAARTLLESVLSRHPHDTEAWIALAEVHLQAQDWAAADHAASQAAETAPAGPRKLHALRALLRLYGGELPRPERIESVYRGILELAPGDLDVRRRWIAELSAAGRKHEALAQQRELLARVTDDDERRTALLDLAAMEMAAPNGRARAEQLFEQAQRTWPDNTEVLGAQVAQYRRLGEPDAARVLLERAVNGSRNALRAGRLEGTLLEKLSFAAGLAGDHDAAQAARATRAALSGERLGISGIGAIAGHPRFDDLLAPAPLSAGFRRLLYGAGAAIERAFAADPTSLDTLPAPDAIANEARAAATAFGLGSVRVAVAKELGCDCTSLYAGQVYVLFGRELLEHEDARLREFLLLRALKIAQVNACAMSRLPPPELWAAVAGFLACFAPPWQAEGADAQRLIAARNRIRPHVTATLSPELCAVTAALTTNVVPQAAQLNDALWRWASRVALLGTGELDVALAALWARDGVGPTPPADEPGRIRWIAGHASARDLVSYGVSEAYIEARRRAGLGLSPS